MCQYMYTYIQPTYRSWWEEAITEILTPRSQSAHKQLTEANKKTFSEDIHKGIPRVSLAVEQKITDLPCMSAYETNHYRQLYGLHTSDFSTSHSVQQTLHSPFAVTRTLTTELEVVWPAIPYFVPPMPHIRGTESCR